MDLFLYVVIVVVVILKIIFWVFYFYSRYKRKEIQRLLTRASGTIHGVNHGRYEEQVAVPQPAFLFSQQGRAMHQYPALPAYAEEDPGKIDAPPPPYLFNGREEAPPIVWRESVHENTDSCPLINSDTSSPPT